MRDLVFIKLGGSIITDTDKPSTPRLDSIDKLLNQIKDLKDSTNFDFIIGHGSGSYAHVPASTYKVNEGLKYDNSKEGAVVTCDTAKELNLLITERALKMGLNLYPFSPSSFASCDNGEIVSGFTDNIELAISNGFIPLVYGDVLMDKSKGVTIASTEKVFSFLAKKLGPKKIIVATDVDGVFTENPFTSTNAKIIKVIDSSDIDEIVGSIGTEVKKAYDVTGGMKTKVYDLYNMLNDIKANFNRESVGYIINGNKPNSIEKIVIGKEIFSSTMVKVT